MSIKSENLIEISGLKAGEKVIQVNRKWVVCGTASGNDMVAGVLVEGDDGNLMFQELAFDGTTPSNVGDPVAIEGTYLYNTGKGEPDYGSGSGGGSMEIYQCVDAEGMTWIVVSGAGSTEANGRYYEGDEVTDEYYGGSYKAYHQQNGSCSFMYKEGQWRIYYGPTILYFDDSYSYHDGDPSQCTSWVVNSGTDPAPTVTKETTTGNGWTGKLYDLETQTLADTETELTYSYTAPKIGKFYTSDGIIGCDVFAGGGLVFYAQLKEYKYTDETGKNLSYEGSVSFEEHQGMYMGMFQDGKILAPTNISSNAVRTFSCMAQRTDTPDSTYPTVISFGSTSSSDYVILYSNKNNELRVTAKNNNTQLCTTFPITSDLSILQHFTVIYDGSKFIAYCNGEYVGESDVLSAEIQASSDICIGARLQDFQGYISEVKVWNRILSAEEIKAEAERCLAMVTTE